LDTPQDYENYDRDVIDAKIGALAEYLEGDELSEDIPAEDIETSRVFIDNAFGMYSNRTQDGSPPKHADGSFAFIVPARMSRRNTEYGEEVEPVIPILRYVPNELRAQMMVGLPPFVIDVYKPDERHRRGYLVFAPVYSDMMEDLPRAEAVQVARKHVNNAVDFAVGRFGVGVAGLGATLPALTRYGQTITNPYVHTTTGHGGTTHLILETVKEGIKRKYAPTDDPRMAVLGLGAIGASIADLVAEEFPGSRLTIYDADTSKMRSTGRKLAARGRAVEYALNERSLIEESDVIISAITGQIDLSTMPGLDLKNRFIVDDSQPGSFYPEQVREKNGKMAWVVGTDKNKNIVRRGYDFATLVSGQSDIFGCEAEAASLAEYRQMLLDRGMLERYTERVISRLALREPVTPKHARAIGGLFKKVGVGVSELQNFGEYLEIKPVPGIPKLRKILGGEI
jgi:predicted amino acid dehydrogenase